MSFILHCLLFICTQVSHINVLTTENNQQKDEINDLQNKVNQQSNEVHDLQSKFNLFMTMFNRSQHIESGQVNCGSSSTWPGRVTAGSADDIYIDKSGKFTRPYEKAPIFHFSVPVLMHTGDDDLYFYASPVKVDKNGFTVRCLTWRRSAVPSMKISWVSLPTA